MVRTIEYVTDYRNTIAGSPPGEPKLIFFWKSKVRLSKTEFLNFRFLATNQ